MAFTVFLQAGKLVSIGETSKEREQFYTKLQALSQYGKDERPLRTKCTLRIERWTPPSRREKLTNKFWVYRRAGVEASGYGAQEYYQIIKEECDIFHAEWLDKNTGEVKVRLRSLTELSVDELVELCRWLHDSLVDTWPKMADKIPEPPNVPS